MENNAIVIIDKLKSDQVFVVKDHEKKTFVIIMIEGKSGQGEIKIIIKGKNANVQILGLILGFAEQQIELYTLQEHQKPQSVSDLFIKSVLFDSAKLKYSGLIKIDKNAQKSNAYQKNQNLLMSDKSWADSRPYLEILANDVRCTHGATIGQLDEDQIYYLKTRGLKDQVARKLLVDGFFKDVLLRIPQEKIRVALEKKISYKVGRLMEMS